MFALLLLLGPTGCDKGAESNRRATERQCKSLAGKYAKLTLEMLRERDESSSKLKTMNDSPMQESLMEAISKDSGLAIGSLCLSEFSRARAACALDATSLEAMASCGPKVSLHSKEEQPSTEHCERLGVHLESLYQESIDANGPHKGEGEGEREAQKREIAAEIVKNTVRDCPLTMTKKQVQCQMRASSLDMLASCTPTPLETKHIDAVIEKEIVKPLEDSLE